MTSGASIRLNAQVQGIGPLFRIKLNIQNAGAKAVTALTVAFHYDHSLYRIKQSVLMVPLVVPVFVGVLAFQCALSKADRPNIVCVCHLERIVFVPRRC